MNRTNIIFLLLILFSCKNENEKSSQSTLDENINVTSKLKKDNFQPESKNEELKVVLGSLQFKLGINDPKVKDLNLLIKPQNINSEIKSGKPNEAEYFTTYFGPIKWNHLEGHVFKQFYTVQAAISKHGHSVLIFVSKNGALYYNMEMPENLPLDLKNGSFRYIYNYDTLKMKIEHISEDDLVLISTENME